MHSDVSRQTYIDFATNSGRFTVGATNAMLDYIRERDGGVKLSYTSTSFQQDYTLEHGMISFDAVSDIGSSTAIGYNYVVTVAHQTSAPMPTFTANDWGIGESRSTKYRGIQEGSRFIHQIFGGEQDYKVVRLSKLVTDVVTSSLYAGDVSKNLMQDNNKALVYHVGGGNHGYWNTDGGLSLDDGSGGVYTVGGIGVINSVRDMGEFQLIYAKTADKTSSGGATSNIPLPFGSQGADSGSPYYVWDSESKSFQLLMTHIGTNGDTLKRGGHAAEWTQQVMEADNVRVNMAWTDGGVQFNGAEVDADKGDSVTDTINGQEVTISPAVGFLSKSDGTNLYTNGYESVTFNGIATGLHTWKSLSDLKDSDTWYGYGDSYLNATESAYNVEDASTGEKYSVIAEGVTYAKLYQTQNVVFEAADDGAEYTIDVRKDTDLGIGYLQFAANGHKDVVYQVKSAGNNLLNSAGYVVDSGVQVDVSLRNTDTTYMREWRKVGEGTLNLCGEGNNEIFLNVGGTGETLLNQKTGYAAYNVLVNTGSVVRIRDAGQIYRDLTFGNGGGTLDMNGVSMDWYTQGGEKRDGFTINALTEEAVITNQAAGKKAVLTYKQGESTHFVGSFRDSTGGSLEIVHDSSGTWELNGIRTQLNNHQDSGLTVKQGTVRLAGTLTVHGYGSEVSDNGKTAHFSTREDDWHYADAAMNVTVEKGASFELASHARLTGDVTVKTGGTYVMHEGVNHAEEYLEGGERKESTAGRVAEFYGHWGDVTLESGADMKIRYSAGTDTATTYSGKVNGPGRVTIELGTDAAPFVMTGEMRGVESVNVVDKSRLQMGDSVTISALATGNATLKAVDSFSADALTGTAENPLSVNNAAIVVSENREFSISHARLENSFVDAGADSTLVLSEVYVAASTKLTDAPATLKVNNTTIEVAIGTNTTVETLTLAESLTLEMPSGTDKVTVESTTEIVQLTSNALNNYTVTGTALTLDLSADSLGYTDGKLLINDAPVGNWLAVSFDDGTPVNFDKNLPIYLTFSSVAELSGVRLQGYYDVCKETAGVAYFRMIPEPSTVTLSLLALTALCLRRRR